MRNVLGFLGVFGFALLALGAADRAEAVGPVNGSNAEKISNYLMDQGTKSLRGKKYDEAIALFEQSVTAYPRNASAFGRLEELAPVDGGLAQFVGFFLLLLEVVVQTVDNQA